ncbi:hypothetical protein BGZ60DRAFT_564070 [Tricladium varicosporioides]|nr:hypothetical protein BGZ60DRAFT_564070 [Hymenoscyphus varicosporioides]
MDDDVPITSPRAHIQKIQQEQGYGKGRTRNENTLEKALEILSDQLYDKATHFLLELIQNADDNTYTVSTPTLNLHYENNSLRVDSNEVGFDARNVEALCSIGNSTKSGSDHSTRYIGEKGIGFKAVFKVADVIWISSGGYNFKLDKRTPLGMITPLWSNSPLQVKPDYATSFYLELSPNYNKQELLHDLRTLDPKMLIFLRRLRAINLTIVDNGKIWKKCIRRSDQEQTFGLVVSLFEDDTSTQYLIRKHHVKDLPTENKRPNCFEAEITFGFPLYEVTKVPEMKSQNVYAFLPIRDYGLQFLLQSDFLLTANRQDIDASSSWNRAICNAFVGAFIKTVEYLNSTPLRYVWPHMIPSEQSTGIFKDFFIEIQNRLSTMPILESCRGSMRAPLQLTYVPSQYSDDEGTPLLLGPQTKSKHLSLKYPPLELESILSLGVHKLSGADFLRDLEVAINEDQQGFRRRSAQWHSQLAKALLKLVVQDEHKLIVASLKIIPLRNGKWVPAENHTIFFSGEAIDLNIPDFLTVQSVDPDAEGDYHRHSLFKNLGVKPLQVSGMCQMICDMHASPTFQAVSIHHDLLIAHAMFLFKASWSPIQKSELWFATRGGGCRRGSSLYVDKAFGRKFSSEKYLECLESKHDFLHDDYYSAFPDDRELWVTWLCDKFNLSRIPRLVTQQGYSFEISDDFRLIVQKFPISDVLQLLISHWEFYSRWIEEKPWMDEEPEYRDSKTGVRNWFSQIEVQFSSGKFPLRQTFLVSIDTDMDSISGLPVLANHDFKDQRWQPLVHLGVSVTKKVGYYLACLHSMRVLVEAALDRVNDIYIIYRKIQAECSGQEKLIRQRFIEIPLIFTKFGGNGKSWKWATSGECVDRKPHLEAEYPKCKQLFRIILEDGETRIAELVKKAMHIKSSDKLETITRIFTEISTTLEGFSQQKAFAALKPLRSVLIFPIKKTEKRSDFSELVSVDCDLNWFIADRDYLEERFCGKVLLIAFTTTELQNMRNLLQALKLNSRRLSKLVKIKTAARGRIELHAGLTNLFRAKSRYLSRLIPTSNPKRPLIEAQLKNIKISSASSITQEYVLNCGSDNITGRPDQGQVASVMDEDSLQIFLTEDGITSYTPPFELISLLADICGITDGSHRSLLQTAVSETSLRRIQEMFYREGLLKREELITEVEVPVNKYTERSGDIPTNPNPFTQLQPQGNEKPGSGLGKSEGQKYVNCSRCGGCEQGQAESVESMPPKENTKSHRPSLPVISDNILEVLSENDEREDPSPNNGMESNSKYESGQRQDILYLGEVLLSRILKRQLGSSFHPQSQWTSSLRVRAGHTPFMGDFRTHSCFTLTKDEGALAFTKFLVRSGYLPAESWSKIPPTYHLEVACTFGDTSSSFVWSIAQLERAREWRLDEALVHVPEDVVVLFRITNVESDILYSVHVDPWKLYMQNQLLLPQEYCLLATLQVSPEQATAPSHASSSRISDRSNLQDRFKVIIKSITENSTDRRPSSPYSINSNPRTIVTPLQHKYRKLGRQDQIRLLCLFPGENSNTLRGVVFHTSLKSGERYRALSYVWGSSSSRKELWTPNGTLWLTPSLHSALLLLRDTEESVNIWADAICINQNDNKEKALQIRLLPKVFQLATSVVAYLGEEAHGSHLALQTLMQIKVNADNTTEWPAKLPPIPSTWATKHIPPPEDRAWHSIRALFSRSWFRRVWIIQEVVAAASIYVVCGKRIVKWNDLFQAVGVIRDQISLQAAEPSYASLTLKLSHFNTLADYREWENRKTRWNLPHLLEAFRYTEATRQRDRFFALLGFAADGNDPAFEPNYDITFDAIVRKYAYAFIHKGMALEMLYRAGLKPTSNLERFPSWIPDWTTPSVGTLYHSSKRGVVCRASGHSREEVDCQFGSDILEVSGHHVDEVRFVSCSANTMPSMEQAGTTHVYLTEVSTIIDSFAHQHRDLRTPLEELKWRVPIADASQPDISASTAIDMRSSYYALMQYLSKPHPQGETSAKYSSSLISSNSDSILAQNYINALSTNLQGWRFIVTKLGYVGIAPNLVKVGDVVTCFSGAGVPFVLRGCGRRGKDRDEWRLVGECYVHGIMRGEAYKEKETYKIWLR